MGKDAGVISHRCHLRLDCPSSKDTYAEGVAFSLRYD